jgi:phosphohistidine phosphatase
MRILVIRHADAGDREAFAGTGRPDSERPLSPKGLAQMSDTAPRLRKLVTAVDHIVTSPYLRARQTAEILRKAYAGSPLLETDALEPDVRPKTLAKYLRERKAETVMCVGHEPQLSIFVDWATTGGRDGFIDLKKGGACLLEFEDQPNRGEGTLRWLFGPKELALLG